MEIAFQNGMCSPQGSDADVSSGEDLVDFVWSQEPCRGQAWSQHPFLFFPYKSALNL